MADEVPYLDCCRHPALETIASLYSSHHDAEALRQCKNCKSHWFYRFSEYVCYAGDDDLTVWYSPLTKDEVAAILAAKENPDLSFLSTRPSFMEDSQGVQKVKGQPTYPRS